MKNFGSSTARIDLLQKLNYAPPAPQFWGENTLKFPRIGGFRGHSSIYARDVHELTFTNLAMKMDFQDRPHALIAHNKRMKIGIGTI